MLGSASGDVSCTTDQGVWPLQPDQQREAALRDLLWRSHPVLILPTRLAATMRGQARRCLECVAGQTARAQNIRQPPQLSQQKFHECNNQIVAFKKPFWNEQNNS